MIKGRPFVKWAGGKRQIIDKLKKYVPDEFNTYYEPFVGGGALLFELSPKNAVINDSNKELMNVYECIKDEKKFEAMCRELNTHEMKHSEEYYKVKVDTEDYRNRRKETLENLATNIAYKVKRPKRPVSLEPMNPYERRIIHTAVQEVEGAVSRSVGNGMDRKVILEPEGGVRRGSSNRRRGERSYAQAKPDPNREKRVDRADIPKFGKIEVNREPENTEA